MFTNCVVILIIENLFYLILHCSDKIETNALFTNEDLTVNTLTLFI